MGNALITGSGGGVKLLAPFVKLNKAGVVRLGLELGVPYELTWSCYNGGEKPCGKCGTCIDRKNAFAANGVPDPALL
jgi:7-cyano-7-deazaguanine synthase